MEPVSMVWRAMANAIAAIVGPEMIVLRALITGRAAMIAMRVPMDGLMEPDPAVVKGIPLKFG
jgi:hypothetical protein